MTPAPGRGLLSEADWRKPLTGTGWRAAHVLLFAILLLAGLGPLLWTLKAAVSSTADLLADPLALWPASPRWGNLADAWTSLEIRHYLLNTVVLVAGSWLVQAVVATTAGYALSVVRPWYGRYVYGAFLITLFVPGTVTLVALYLTVLDLPGLNVSIANTPLAVWLPAGAHAFNILLAKQFFDAIPRELFEAARVDGAGSWTVFRRIVLPMSTPILAVISLFAVMNAWKDFLWPLIAITDPQAQPIAVALPRLAQAAEPALLVAGLLIATVPPLLIFLIFQRYVVRGIAFTGLKG
ncbi:multiple sugar transport system permease protein [Thermocatellispora tengchongensis]|uniref:Multiple sugar transport system permease protein n=1 Tax=Thermocatellispora tengchongensis TaxID=1073253 RepID=A0A840PPB6_9ACTN|nr:carbohydrate ABC transporter permease [Thermocatellispora tengchongensis]MBB5138917.1 multiple sugar transport system permease protein [Thermocatellispora tengchongensis]